MTGRFKLERNRNGNDLIVTNDMQPLRLGTLFLRREPSGTIHKLAEVDRIIDNKFVDYILDKLDTNTEYDIKHILIESEQ